MSCRGLLIVALAPPEQGSPGSDPKSLGGVRCLVAASYADAMRNSIGSSKGRATKSTPTYFCSENEKDVAYFK